tara:strand:- start:54 stop:338 length:285 start_codon:yes stop_codon:yes gene_type:complete
MLKTASVSWQHAKVSEIEGNLSKSLIKVEDEVKQRREIYGKLSNQVSKLTNLKTTLNMATRILEKENELGVIEEIEKQKAATQKFSEFVPNVSF